MLYLFAMVLSILWLLGLVTNFTLGGFIHLLLALAAVMALLNFYLGGKPA